MTKVVNGQSQVVSRHDFMPFGEEVNPPSPPAEKRLFTGQERDFETGLDYFNARQLAPGLGRFTSVDPLGDGYSYASNNPLRFVDTTGLFVSDVLGSALGALYVAAMYAQGPTVTFRSETVVQYVEVGEGDLFAISPPDRSMVMFASAITQRVGALGEPERLAASVVGLDWKNPRPSCVGIYLRETLLNLFPWTPSWAAVANEVGKGYTLYGANSALKYAAERGLTYPQKSSVFRSLFTRGLRYTPPFTLGTAQFQALIAEGKAALSGNCQ